MSAEVNLLHALFQMNSGVFFCLASPVGVWGALVSLVRGSIEENCHPHLVSVERKSILADLEKKLAVVLWQFQLKVCEW